MDYAGQGICCDISEAQADTLCHMIDYMTQAQSRGGYDDCAARLRAKARENTEIAFGLIS